METTTIHPAEAYLRNEQNPASLYVSGKSTQSSPLNSQ